jgi:hypothetical protein
MRMMAQNGQPFTHREWEKCISSVENEEEENAGQAKIKDVCHEPEPGSLS